MRPNRGYENSKWKGAVGWDHPAGVNPGTNSMHIWESRIDNDYVPSVSFALSKECTHVVDILSQSAEHPGRLSQAYSKVKRFRYNHTNKQRSILKADGTSY